MSKALYVALLALTVSVAPAAATALAADPAAPPTTAPASRIMTILTQPGETRLRLESNGSEFRGPSPLDLPATFGGRFAVTVEGPAVARTRGTIDVPSRGVVTLLSEPRGPSFDLLVRSLNLPGVANFTTGRRIRGAVLALAFTGGMAGAVRAHLQYRDRLGEFGDYSADRARDERLARNDWARFAAATWAASAVDYWLRPRLDIEEAANERVVVSAPGLSRTSIVLRSLLVPGAGQEFANHPGRGALWLGAALTAGAGIAFADAQVERDQTQADWAKAMIDSVGPSERASRQRAYEHAKNDLQSSEDLRRGFRYAVIGAWVVNVVDALLVPTGKPSPAAPARVSTSAIVRPGSTQLVATLHF